MSQLYREKQKKEKRSGKTRKGRKKINERVAFRTWKVRYCGDEKESKDFGNITKGAAII